MSDRQGSRSSPSVQSTNEPHSLSVPRRLISRRTFLQAVVAGSSFAVVMAGCAPAAAPAPAESAPAPAAPAEAGAPASAEGGLLRPGGSPKRGGTLRTAFGVTTSNYDIHQGASSSVLSHEYAGKCAARTHPPEHKQYQSVFS